MEELLKALRTIQDECKRHDSCKACPLYSETCERCGVMEIYPESWKFIEAPIPRLIL